MERKNTTDAVISLVTYLQELEEEEMKVGSGGSCPLY